MTITRLGSLLAATLLAAGGLSAQQNLVCPPASALSGKPCEVFHYHVQMYRPDTRTFADIVAANQFSSQSACDRARDAQMKRNLAVVDFFRKVKNDDRYEPDRLGPCHCDTSGLTDAQRTGQLRLAEEVRQRVRERLLDEGLKSDNELVRGLYAMAASSPMVALPKLVAPPRPVAVTGTNATSDLKMTRAVDTNKPATATLDLPLVDVSGTPAAPAVVAEAPNVAQPLQVAQAPEAPKSEPTPTPAATTPEPPPAQAGELAPRPTSDPPEQATVAPEPTELATDVADAFLSYETERIQNVIKATSTMDEGEMKTKIFEACMQRLNLLSNLRSLIEGSGVRSRLATAAKAARSESDRVELMAKLFGNDIQRHWAPKDAADVIIDIPADVASEPERALRDTTGKFSMQQKRRALYAMLAQTQPTEEQRLWLSTVIDSFLQ